MTELPDLTEVVPEGSITLPIKGVKYRFVPCGAALGYALSKAASGGRSTTRLLPDDRKAAEYRDLFGEHYDALGPLDGQVKLSHPEFEHLSITLITFNLFGRVAAESVWKRTPEHWAPAAVDASSAGAPKSTASTSGTSGTTVRRSPRKRPRRG